MTAARSIRIRAIACLTVLSSVAARADELTVLAEGWQYRWGDSPREAGGAFAWLHPEEEGWLDIGYPSNPPDRAGRRNAWYRVPLPLLELRDPALFIYSIDVNAELYVDGILVYSWGEIDEQGTGKFRGWPWHVVRLPLDSPGGALTVRVYSDYRDIGLWGPVMFGERYALVNRMYFRDAPRLAVAVASGLIAVALILLYLLQRPRQPMAIDLAFATLALVARVVARTYARQILLGPPLFWLYLAHASAFAIAIFITLIIRRALAGTFQRVTGSLCVTLLVLLAVSVLASLTGLVGIEAASPAYDVLLIVVVVLLFALSLRAAVAGNTDARLLSVNFGIMGGLTIYSILVSNSILAWADEVDYLIVFLFSLGLCVLIARRVSTLSRRLREQAATLEDQSRRLQDVNQELERKVDERTRDLELANRRLSEEKQHLQIVSITDVLTGMHNRMYVLERLRQAVSHAHRYGERLSVLMFDLDYFKEVNDTWGHPAGDAVLRRVAEVFGNTLRETDLAGRYGGEEFLVVLPRADAAEARLVAERIRTRIEELQVRAGEHWLTASGGIAEYSGQGDENLLHEADRSLYRAKQTGRNRVAGPDSGGAA